MPIQFACPACARQYSVKDELAGKSAKCGQCGHKMKIPLAAAPSAASAQTAATKSTPAPSNISSSSLSNASKPSAAQPVAKIAPPKAPPSDPGMSSWLDEELESSRVEAKNKPKPPAPTDTSCPSCNGPRMPGAVICVKCGYDTRIRGKRSVERGTEDEPKQRSKLGSATSLLRGTFFSFIAAMFGAFVWAVLAYFTMYEFSIVAWGLGGLAGLGMAPGYEADDGTFAGIIAAFMSLLGIIAAKVFIVVIFIAAIVSSAVSEMEIEPAADAAAMQADDPVEMQRSMLAMALAMKDLEASGESVSDAGDERWTAAMSKARAEVASLTPEEIETRINELGKQHGLDGKVEDFDGDDELGDEEALADDEEEFDAEDAEAGNDELEDEDVTFGAVVGSLFGPMDGLFILLAFFTAYKVGSGEATD